MTRYICTLFLVFAACDSAPSIANDDKKGGREKGEVVAAKVDSNYPDPSGFDVTIGIGIGDLFKAAGYPSSGLIEDKKIQKDMIDTMNLWYAKDKKKRKFFAVSPFSRDWKIKRRNGNPTGRSVCSAFFWIDERGLCQVNGYRLGQQFDGVSYSKRFKHKDGCFFPSEADLRPMADPGTVYPAGSHETTTAPFRGPGNLIEECSDPTAFKAFVADAESKKKAKASKKKKPKTKPSKKKSTKKKSSSETSRTR